MINANDPDKGVVPYHKGIQLTWKDDVRNPEEVPGKLFIGIDADKNIVREASLVNEGDIVVVPGEIELYGKMTNTKGKIYLADVTEAVVPIQPSAEQPLVVEIRVDVDPMRPGLINVDKDAVLDVADGSVMGATVQVVSNGQLGDMTTTEYAKGVNDQLKQDANVIAARMDETELKKDKDYILKDGSVEFTESFLKTFAGKHTVKINIGYRIYEYEVTGTKKGDWKKDSKGWKYLYVSGKYAKSCGEEIDGKQYYFDKDGYMESNAYREGYYLTKSGAWDGKAAAEGWRQSSKGWWYPTTGKSYLKNTWMKIDGKWYYFHANGYMAANEFVKGYWLNKNGSWTDTTVYSWHKTAKGWWYGVAGGWYAKNKTYTIDGKSYTFDKKGYLIEK